ncbi:hypothetical protein N836_31665 [Leptolyngbya sp. Heron Island J]|nr:hypothetical protein N836_31665 [Leptolyngbya sp. Heron Island J]
MIWKRILPFVILFAVAQTPSYAQLDNTPFDPGTWSNGGRDVIDNLTSYNFNLRNRCATDMQVEIEYIPSGSNDWETAYYVFVPGERGYLVDTRNRYVYVTAEPTIDYGWRIRRHRVDMGNAFVRFEHRIC